MRHLKRGAAFLLLGGLLLSGTCKTKDANHNPCEGVACTALFAMVMVEVVDSTGKPAVLDSTVTISSSGNIIPTTPVPANPGYYTVVDDGYKQMLELRTEQVTFKGFKRGKQVTEGTFVVRADCCHVSKVSGPGVLTIP